MARDHDLRPRSARDFFEALFSDRREPSCLGNVSELRDVAIDPFGELCSEPLRLKEFLSSMTERSHAANRAVAHRLPWWDYRTFVDVGAGQGDLAVEVALANPHLHGTGIDLAAISPIFEDYASERGVSDRVTFAAGDLLADPLPETDVVLMGHGLLFHDFDLEPRRTLVKKAYQALSRGGSLVVYENSLDHAGDEGTAACRRWMQEAGFCHSRVEPLTATESIVVGRK